MQCLWMPFWWGRMKQQMKALQCGGLCCCQVYASNLGIIIDPPQLNYLVDWNILSNPTWTSPALQHCGLHQQDSLLILKVCLWRHPISLFSNWFFLVCNCHTQQHSIHFQARAGRISRAPSRKRPSTMALSCSQIVVKKRTENDFAAITMSFTRDINFLAAHVEASMRVLLALQ